MFAQHRSQSQDKCHDKLQRLQSEHTLPSLTVGADAVKVMLELLTRMALLIVNVALDPLVGVQSTKLL